MKSGPNKKLHHFHMPLVDCKEKGRVTSLRRVHLVGLCVDLKLHHFQMPFLGCNAKRRVTSLRLLILVGL